ncbi:TPA: RagB/SusD family nutrient uptake outer membrane protein [Elizabethkingia anophelis]|uniref:RagB/SusD family nutrient uptake outer membrane protein n=1 Tax=Elizabethkingia anophelis TaxID=1117645 RepID=UPI0004263734|nr:RagB/SusD family nutrient uptake outer membrane protein [Elizabethkingia anophelis]MCT3744371.1 RagB/SusD family nutrient uptake outer membrane protein [Elizabethkingia anophelis]MDV3489744.1 RagB/SusD family nutrient uptake outer membrane protein [Elizabethkingia anophelis]MDV3873154.1 RagB/SusD family nutrient uptake outer membrane protein [Elizabethkingia anophelis]MDV4084685.1 RagB/SusD family nutrient uptake outer membrane protein [Elizabethkingia anophelis]MDV4129268.1 RagB/SusD famil
MKNNIYKIVLGVASLVFVGASVTSCQDAIDIVQPGQLDDESTFKSISDLDLYLNGIYNIVDPTNEVYISAILSDEVKPGKGSGGQEFQQHRFFFDSSDKFATNTWLIYNTVINRVNRILEGAKSVDATRDQAKYNQIIGQARALRAFAYLQLETYFSPNMKDDNALGAIIFKDVPSISQKLPRSKNAEVYAFIEEDLNFASDNVQEKGANQYYVDKTVVDAIRARFYLYRGKYELAQKYAQEVLNKSGLTLTKATPVVPNDQTPIGSSAWNTAFYADSSFNPYRQLWGDINRGEVVFALARPARGSNSTINSLWNTNASNINGNPMWFWGRNLYNIFANTPGDIRKYAYVDPSSKPNANYETISNTREDQLVIDKYPGKANGPLRNDFKVFRLSEMYFILAETTAQQGQLTESAKYIKQVRDARNYQGSVAMPNYASKQDALKDILLERRVELALEGHRYIDLKRLANDAGVTMDRNKTDDIVDVTNLPNNSYKYTFPIPNSEIQGNRGIIQNDGYAK